MKWIDYVRPHTLQEAISLLTERGEKARVLAGGTDLIVNLRVGKLDTDLLVDGKYIPELNRISYDPADGLTLGAVVPCYKISSNEAVASAYPGLIDSASLIGGVQIQGRATIGGNLCNAAPSADSIPSLIVLKATAMIVGPGGTRKVPVEDFCTDPGQTVLKPGDVLVSLHLPPPKENSGAGYLRFTPRNEMDIAVAGVGVSVELENGTFKSARIALAAVAPTPLFVKEAGETLVGRMVNDKSIAEAAKIARDAAKPINDMRGTIEFRKHLCEVLTRRALNKAIERARGGDANAR